MIYTYNVCDACSTGLSNDDWSAYDPDHLDTIEANVEMMGWVVPAGEIIDGYLDCWVCDEVCLDGQIWEAMLSSV